MITYTCDVCGQASQEMPATLMGDDYAAAPVWTMQLCDKVACLVTALTKMREPQGVRGFQYHRGYRETPPKLDNG